MTASKGGHDSNRYFRLIHSLLPHYDGSGSKSYSNDLQACLWSEIKND